MTIIYKAKFNLEHKNWCAHDYKIINYIMKHPEGGCVVMGDDGRSHVVHEDCVRGSGFVSPEII